RLIRQEDREEFPAPIRAQRTLWLGRRETVGVRVIYRRAVNLIYAGWLPQDGVSAGAVPLGLVTSVASPAGFLKLLTHSLGAGPSPQYLQQPRHGQVLSRIHTSIPASDQHQPANSRAIAALAVFAVFPRQGSATTADAASWCPRLHVL